MKLHTLVVIAVLFTACAVVHGFPFQEGKQLNLAADGINVRVIDMYSIKPLDKELIFKAVKETGNIVVLEDHLMDGGLASVIADAFVDSGVYPKNFKRLGIPQVYAGFGSGEELRKKYGYDQTAAVAVIKKMLK